jgi:hypothetical protein
MKPDYTRYECDEKLEGFWVSIVIIPDIGQFITFCGDKARDKDYLPEVQPSTRTVGQREKGERVHSSSRLRECQTKEPSSSKPMAQKRPAKTA